MFPQAGLGGDEGGAALGGEVGHSNPSRGCVAVNLRKRRGKVLPAIEFGPQCGEILGDRRTIWERDAAGESALNRVRKRLFGDSPQELLLHLVDTELDPGELRRMRDLLDRRLREMEEEE